MCGCASRARTARWQTQGKISQYGKITEESLPRYTTTQDIAEADRFMRNSSGFVQVSAAGADDFGGCMFQVSVEESFSAGHALRGYKGKCENPHGHNYKVRVTLEGTTLDSVGLLYDFVHLKQIIHSVINALDHKFLNDLAPFDVINPSAENIARYFYEEASKQLHGASNGARIASITVWETDTTAATYWP